MDERRTYRSRLQGEKQPCAVDINEKREVYAHNFEFAMRNYDEVVGYKKKARRMPAPQHIRSLWEMSHTVINAMLPCEEGNSCS